MPASATRSSKAVRLNAQPLTIEEIVRVARSGSAVSLGPRARVLVAQARGVVERSTRDGEAHYGINTGFGALAKKRIDDADLRTLQRNLIRSHSAGVGEPLRDELVRAMMLLLAASLARGHSGVRPVVIETLIAMLNRGVTPVVPSIGSVGASGDLAPLAAIALVMIGEGHATYKGRQIAGGKALSSAGISPIALEAKEGLALINGTHLMAAEGALLASDAARLIDAATLALAMSIDACRATDAFLDPRLYAARPHPRVIDTCARLRALLKGSGIVTSHVENDPRVQDPYSLRAGPTILGSASQGLEALSAALAVELASVTDNPLVFAKGVHGTRATSGEVLSGANFHGMPLAIPLDAATIAFAHVAGASERRSYLMTGAFEPESHLKPFLAPRGGLQSGLMIAQYAAAACVNEIITLSTPASVSNIPTCAGMEDYNSFGPRAAAKARRALELAEHVVAIELLCAAEGLECHRPHRSGTLVEKAHATIRQRVKRLTDDRHLTPDIDAIVGLIRDGALRTP